MGRVATLQDMERIALRYDTAMSRAMLKALGVARPPGAAAPPGRAPRGVMPPGAYDGAYRGIGECFANKGRGVIL